MLTSHHHHWCRMLAWKADEMLQPTIKETERSNSITPRSSLCRRIPRSRAGPTDHANENTQVRRQTRFHGDKFHRGQWCFTGWRLPERCGHRCFARNWGLFWYKMGSFLVQNCIIQNHVYHATSSHITLYLVVSRKLELDRRQLDT